MKKNYHHILNVKRGWTKIPNAIRHDEKLTSDAKVVIEELLAVSGDYHIHESGIASALNLSLVRVKKAIKLLKDTGYIQITYVKNGSRFGGCEWGISDTSSVFQQAENHTSGNRTTGNDENHSSNPSSSKTELPEYGSSEILSTYQITERFNEQKNEELSDEGQRNELLHHQPDAGVAVEVFPPTPNNHSSFTDSGKQVISPMEYQFQQFLKKYPKAPLARELEETRKAFFDAVGLDGGFAVIMAGLDEWCRSTEWGKDNGRWIKKPMNWLKERQWEKSEIARAEERRNRRLSRLNELFPDEEV